MHIDKFKQPNLSYLDEDDIYYDNAEDFIQTKILGFCGCGDQEANLFYIRDVLQYIDRLKTHVHEDILTFQDWYAEGDELFKTEGARYFAYYFMDREELTEHGSSVPGWLTEKGYELLEDLNELLGD